MQNLQSSKYWLGIYIRGVAMGAADVVPGVSGGTVAFITGIYEELLTSIKSINLSALSILFKQGMAACWQHINGTFLLVLVSGILTSVFTLASLIKFLLTNHPLLVWSFFFGLIVASSVHMAKQIQQWQATTLVALLLGVLAAYMVGEIKPSELPAELPLVFLSGAIAICAMILPGISGSFVLVLLGMYGHILTAVRDFNLLILITFAAGCGLGLVSFSGLLSWLLSRFHASTLALLTGFLIGSLSLVWPWKHTLSFYQNSKGQQLALQQENVLPDTFQSLTGTDPNTIFCLILMLSGLALVFLLEKIGQKTA
jgi:putative membrane protein